MVTVTGRGTTQGKSLKMVMYLHWVMKNARLRQDESWGFPPRGPHVFHGKSKIQTFRLPVQPTSTASVSTNEKRYKYLVYIYIYIYIWYKRIFCINPVQPPKKNLSTNYAEFFACTLFMKINEDPIRHSILNLSSFCFYSDHARSV